MLSGKTKLPSFCLVLAVYLVTVHLDLRPAYAKSSPMARKRLNALDDDARKRLNAALREMRRRGLQPRVNSTFRSHAEQQSLYRCARRKRCKTRRGVYGAKPPGSSMHEAGLAVDLGGIATGSRRRRLTPKGRKTVQIMRKHGFTWRYGLKDPAHFELSPKHAGYRNKQAAIKASQQRWHKSTRAKRRARR